MKTFIVQLKDAGFDPLAIVEADDAVDAVKKLSSSNEFDPGLTDNYQVHQLDELTISFYGF